MFRCMLISVVLAVTAGCAATAPVRAPISKSDLLSGAALFDGPAPPHPIGSEEVMRLDPEMRTFVAKQIAGATSSELKLKRLLRGMQDKGLLSIDYNAGATWTVRQTFNRRQGNCLSFTMLFVALAREAGLRVGYEMVDVPPNWSTDSGFLVLAKHINARVTAGRDRGYAVDFDVEDFRGDYGRHAVSDRYALALFYTNRGAEALLAGDYRASFANFRQAIETDSRVPGAWVNLGMLYSRLERRDYAESAYLQALNVEPDEPSALTDLAAFYTKVGDAEQAEIYRKRVHRYQQQNPYYHYFLAREAYKQKHFAEALDSIDRAIKLKRREPQFYFLQGLAYDRLGRGDDAARSFARADAYPAPTALRAERPLSLY